MNCPRCGANIGPTAFVCPYCQTQTAYGREQAERQAAQQYHAARADEAQRAAEQQQQQAALNKKAQHAMFWSLAGMFTCCFPAAIVGLVMGLNVKSVAKKEGRVAPTTSTVAVVAAGFGLALFCLLTALFIHDSREKDARVALLEAQVAHSRAQPTIAQPVACALAELHLLQEGFGETSGINVAGFQCDGKLEMATDGAILHDVRFRTSSTDKHVVAACLVRGIRWSIKELRADGSCGARPAGSASASTSAGGSP